MYLGIGSLPKTRNSTGFPNITLEHIGGMDMNRKHYGCKVEGCTRKHRANGYCCRHEAQLRKRGYIFGDPSRSKKDRNFYTIDGDVTIMKIFNNYSEVKCESLIDTVNLKKCRNYKWSITGDGYASCKINGRNIPLHRFVLGMNSGECVCDHINRNRLDNRISNLRICTHSQNILNSGIRKDNTSGYKGVYFHDNKWQTHIDMGRKRLNIGAFTTAECAALAYNEAAKKLHGEFAYLNEVRQ
jgi:hypothetical protein